MIIYNPGNTIIHQELVNKALEDSERTLPQEIILTGRPRPRKLNVDS